jgi:hypothetical protein
MPERYWIAEGPVEAEGGVLSLIAYVETEEEKNLFKTYVDVHIVSPVEGRARSEAEFQVINPLDVVGTVATASGAYAACVAWRMTRYSMRQASQCYKDSKKNNPGLTPSQRTRDVAQCLSQNESKFKKEAGNALLDCIPFRNLFSGDDNDTGRDGSDG